MFKRKSFAEYFKALREEAGLTQEELAKASGVSRNTIGNIETEKLLPTINTCLILACAIGNKTQQDGFELFTDWMVAANEG